MQQIDRITVDAIADDTIADDAIADDPREASLITGAHVLGFTDVRRIQVADVLVDPLLQRGHWGTPNDPDGVVVIETSLLPGVTDSVRVG